VSLLEEIDKRAAQIDKVQRVLIELNVAGEESKSGVEPAGLDTIVRAAAGLSHVRIEGLMTMAPLVSDPESVRPVFRQTAAIFDKMSKTTAPNVEMTYLSMGMTDDFEVAIEEGSNMVRIGRAIFAS
jgi:pyridoxal phosphate enzyme (YggS family)